MKHILTKWNQYMASRFKRNVKILSAAGGHYQTDTLSHVV